MVITRTPKDTYASSARIVMPNDTNTLGNLMGGNLLNWMDITAAISAHRCSRRLCVTAAVNNVSFKRPIKLGDIVTIHAEVTRSFSSSMEVYMKVHVENHVTGEQSLCNEGHRRDRAQGAVCLIYTNRGFNAAMTRASLT